MALTITVPQLAAAIRLQDSPTAAVPEPHLSIIHRQLAVADGLITEYVVDTTPDEVKDEAAVLIVGYLLDAPGGSLAPGQTPGNAFIHSGARQLLAPWHEPAAEKLG